MPRNVKQCDQTLQLKEEKEIIAEKKEDMMLSYSYHVLQVEIDKAHFNTIVYHEQIPSIGCDVKDTSSIL